MSALSVALIVGLCAILAALIPVWYRRKERDEDRKVAAALATDVREIKGLANSSMTAAMQSELDSARGMLAALRELVALKQTAGHEPSSGALDAITQTEDQISKLSGAIKARQRQAELAEAESLTRVAGY